MNYYQKKEIQKDREEYKKIILEQMKKISNLDKKKISKFKNTLLRIMSLGLYNWNKRIDKKIIALQDNIGFYQFKIGEIDRMLRKNDEVTKNNCDNFKNKINSLDFQNQLSTNGYKPNSPKM